MNVDNVKRFFLIFTKALLLMSLPFFIIEIGLIAFFRGGDMVFLNLKSAIFRAVAMAIFFGVAGIIKHKKK